MAVSEPVRGGAWDAPRRRPTGPEPGPLYDAFVVRLWREAGTGRLLRAEVEHVQSGVVTSERGVAPDWILHCLQACLDGHPADGDGGTERDAPRQGV